jgi:hypothetical protein
VTGSTCLTTSSVGCDSKNFMASIRKQVKAKNPTTMNMFASSTENTKFTVDAELFIKNEEDHNKMS